MLTELTIENVAIIDRLSVRFGGGLTVLTGETGAGKSIIIDALQMTLGTRVSSDIVRSGAAAAAVEAVFEIDTEVRSGLSAVLAEYGLQDDDCLVLRREISSSGRGTARVNGRALPASVLAALGAMLVDIHGQSEHLSILRRDRQLDVLDRYGGLTALRRQVADALREYSRLRRQLDELLTGRREAEQRVDLLRFQVQEIEAAQLKPEEEENLVAERNLLGNAERRAALAQEAFHELQRESGGAVEALGAAAGALRDLAAIDPSLAELHERLQGALYEVDDAAQELRRYRDAVEYDPARLQEIEERIDTLTRLKRKYGPTVEEIIAFGDRARREMEDVENIDDRIDELSREIEQAGGEAGSLAADLSASRVEAGARLSAAMADALQGLGLRSTRFEVQIERCEEEGGLRLPDGKAYAVSGSGVDYVSFLVSFNPGEAMRPIERVASGGETSRFLLALKSVLADADETPTLVFDEVDVGVGGRHGGVVGARLRDLAQSHQVLSITQLPQIAAMADQHLTVMKSSAGGRTGVEVRALSGEDRVLEIAQMMSGTGTDTARRNAEELLEAGKRPT